MWVRRGFFAWLFPAAIVLPVWLVVGWAIFNASGWAFLGTIFVAAPAVFAGELIVALLIRSRPAVRASRAVSWWDVLWVTVWHGLVIALGCFFQTSFALILVCAILGFLALFWSSLAQLWAQARNSFARLWPSVAGSDAPDRGTDVDREGRHGRMIVVTEADRPGDGRSPR